MAAATWWFCARGWVAPRVPHKVQAEQLCRDGEAGPGGPRGPFSVRGLERKPRGRPCLKPGKDVMVMDVIQKCNPEPWVQAAKMTSLSDNPVHERTWELEVEDLHRNNP